LFFRCEGVSPETPEIFPEIPDFPETPEKSPEYPGFTDKLILSGDFQDSPIHPPLGDIKILSVRMAADQRDEVRTSFCDRGRSEDGERRR
jgi:hypothetical protein